MPKDFTLSKTANHDRIVPCLGSRVVKAGETVSFPDEFVDGLRGQDDWQPSGWSWPADEKPAPVPDVIEAAAPAAAAEPPHDA